MRHHNKIKKFGRTKQQREALMRSLAVGLIEHGRITTTQAKAKALRPFIEKLVSRARVDSLANRRVLLSRLNNNTATVDTLLREIGPRYTDRPGGYVRVVKLPPRESDASNMAVIEFV